MDLVRYLVSPFYIFAVLQFVLVTYKWVLYWNKTIWDVGNGHKRTVHYWAGRMFSDCQSWRNNRPRWLALSVTWKLNLNSFDVIPFKVMVSRPHYVFLECSSLNGLNLMIRQKIEFGRSRTFYYRLQEHDLGMILTMVTWHSLYILNISNQVSSWTIMNILSVFWNLATRYSELNSNKVTDKLILLSSG